jgi:mRNA-degrading endonuclease RelE of RelBE toxin-antitoxin system
MMKTLASDQVAAWIVSLPPETKKRVRLSLRELEKGRGDIRALKKELEGWCRLRVGGLRIIFRTLPGKIIRLEYAAERDTVYENFLRVIEARRKR